MTVTTDRGTQQFTRMDEGTKEHWMEIVTEHGKNADRVPKRIIGMLESLEEIVDGFSTNQLVHVLQTATLAEKAGADEELIVASLCHDIGKAVSVANHGAIAAEIIKSYVRPDVYNVIRTHQDFQGRHYYEYLGMDPDAREKYRGEPWFGWVSSSPTSGIRSPSIPTARRTRSSTSSRWSSAFSCTRPSSPTTNPSAPPDYLARDESEGPHTSPGTSSRRC